MPRGGRHLPPVTLIEQRFVRGRVAVGSAVNVGSANSFCLSACLGSFRIGSNAPVVPLDASYRCWESRGWSPKSQYRSTQTVALLSECVLGCQLTPFFISSCTWCVHMAARTEILSLQKCYLGFGCRGVLGLAGSGWTKPYLAMYPCFDVAMLG